METSKDILNELNQLSPLLAGLQKVNVFTVPSGYFNRLAEDILVGIREGENNLLSSVPNQSAIQVPQGYFESLADHILNKIKMEESAAAELKVLSPMLYGIQNKNVFTVPQGYFETFAGNALNNINEAAGVAAELKELSPTLHNIQNKNIYAVPDNYFETLAAKILDTVKPQQAKVVTMRTRTAVIFKYAAAAVFTGVLALGVFKFTGNKIEVDTVVAEGKQIARDNKFDEELAKVTDTDIVKYLEENGSDADDALVANTIDENELPTEEDYLTDDKALDKYLDNININDLKN
jgi:major membrane immunogen (membrane-anchored lipoprotein)